MIISSPNLLRPGSVPRMSCLCHLMSAAAAVVRARSAVMMAHMETDHLCSDVYIKAHRSRISAKFQRRDVLPEANNVK